MKIVIEELNNGFTISSDGLYYKYDTKKAKWLSCEKRLNDIAENSEKVIELLNQFFHTEVKNQK